MIFILYNDFLTSATYYFKVHTTDYHLISIFSRLRKKYAATVKRNSIKNFNVPFFIAIDLSLKEEINRFKYISFEEIELVTLEN